MSIRATILRGLFVATAAIYGHSGNVRAAGANPDDSIREIRTGTLVIEAAPGAEVRVEQLRHEFWFGAALANPFFAGRPDGETAAKYKQVFLENFNAAVTENALKWHSMEPRQREVDYGVVDRMLAWTTEHEVPLRGHNVFWGIPNRVQPWLKTMDDDTLLATLKARAVDIARRYRGRWNGRQFLSTSWVDQATAVQVPPTLPNDGLPRSRGAGVYGFNWWVNGIKPDGQRLWPGAPPRTFYANGLHNNVCIVVPEWNLVIARTNGARKDGSANTPANVDEIWSGFFTRLAEAMTP